MPPPTRTGQALLHLPLPCRCSVLALKACTIEFGPFITQGTYVLLRIGISGFTVTNSCSCSGGSYSRSIKHNARQIGHPGRQGAGQAELSESQGLTGANRSSFNFGLLVIALSYSSGSSEGIDSCNGWRSQPLANKQSSNLSRRSREERSGSSCCASRTRFGLQTRPPALFGERLSYHWETERLTRNDSRPAIRDAWYLYLYLFIFTLPPRDRMP
jgi:hypothetical protein